MLNQQAVVLIKQFEGCHLTAYPDPLSGGKPYTIGYGSTRDEQGRAFQLGQKITYQRADQLLNHEIQLIEKTLSVDVPYWSEMSEKQQAALISFAYNLGSGFMRASGFNTIQRALREKRWNDVPNALMLYVNPNANVEAGLRRRRKAEGDLWREGMTEQQYPRPIYALRDTWLKKEPIQSVSLTSDQKVFCPKGEKKSIVWASSEIVSGHRKISLDYNAGNWWIFDSDWSYSFERPNPLLVPYFDQKDNASGFGYRECFSSSCAMVAAYYGKVKTDDEYNLIRQRYGDTINPAAQVKTLQSLGLKAAFRVRGTRQGLEQAIRDGFPTPVGWLHHGTSQNPTGGGHWSVIVGTYPEGFIHHDPYGEAYLASGGHNTNKTGKNIRYSWKNFEPRWKAEGHGEPNWYMEIRP